MRRRSATWLVALCAAFLLPSLIFAGGRLLLPGDGVLLDLQNEPPGGRGLFVGELLSERSPLRVGDLLISVDGHTVESLLAQPPFASTGSLSQQVDLDYVAERGSQRIMRSAALQRPNLLAGLLANWPSYLFLIYMLGMAAFVFARRPDLPAARGLLWATTLVFGSGLVFFLGLQPTELLRGWPKVIFLWAVVPLYGLGLAAGAHFALLFPQRRAWMAGRSWLVPALYIGPWLLWLPLLASGWEAAASASDRLLLALRLSGIFSTVYPLLIVSLLLQGYRREFDTKQRRQTRWILWGAGVVILPWIGGSAIPTLFGSEPLLPQFVIGLLWLVFPTAFGIAIVRESLFDIDRIINRTLVYGSLTVILVLLYLGVVVALQRAFEGLTGQQSPLAIVISTLLIAAAFQPLRQRIQTGIDRRFFRRRYDTGQALNQLSQELSQRVELSELSQSVLSMVQDSLQPVHLSLWLRQHEPRQ